MSEIVEFFLEAAARECMPRLEELDHAIAAVVIANMGEYRRAPRGAPADRFKFKAVRLTNA